jgi:hypothetical protein
MLTARYLCMDFIFMQNNPRPLASSRLFLPRPSVRRTALFAGGLTGKALLQAPTRAADAAPDTKRKLSGASCLFQAFSWIAGALAFLGALMALAHIAFTHSIR